MIRGAIAGILSGGLALGVAQLVAGLITSDSSPVVAVGQLSIDLSPPFLKNFAISAFGSHDKVVLVAGILVVLAIFAAAVGVLAVRRLAYGMAGLALFALVGLIAAVSRPGASVSDALPTLAGAAAAALALRRFTRLAVAAAPAGAAVTPAQDTATAPAATPAPDTPDTPAAPAAPARSEDEPRYATPGGWPAPADGQQPRRSFLTTGAVVAGTALVAGAGGRLLAERGNVAAARQSLRIPAPRTSAPPLPAGVDLNIPGLGPFVTPNASFYRVDTAIVLPEIPPASWQLRIHGMVARELTLSFHDLIRQPLTEEYITLCCVSNPVGGPYIGNARWLGASLASVLRQAGIRSGADQLLCTSSDGFTSGTPVQTVMDGRDAMLAVAMNGTALPVEHGFPVRMVVPGLYGYVSATKWVTDIEVTTFARSHAYWTVRGWSQQAPIKTESRIDVPRSGAALRSGQHTVAGVAWAQHKGIDAVHVRVDRGPWQQARLAAVPGIDTWRQWAWDWAATPGTHQIEARATDRTGYTQTAQLAPLEPNGATGYPSVRVKVG
jgi:DMSO/TMAO reductase YedYZ molybdopterin-dependent catalytic subunit